MTTMKIMMTQCDGCKRAVERPEEHAGWLLLHDINGTGQVSVHRTTGGRDRAGDLTADFLAKVDAFCSVRCFVETLDRKAQERADGARLLAIRDDNERERGAR